MGTTASEIEIGFEVKEVVFGVRDDDNNDDDDEDEDGEDEKMDHAYIKRSTCISCIPLLLERSKDRRKDYLNLGFEGTCEGVKEGGRGEAVEVEGS